MADGKWRMVEGFIARIDRFSVGFFQFCHKVENCTKLTVNPLPLAAHPRP